MEEKLEILQELGDEYSVASEQEKAREYYEAALELSRELEDRGVEAGILRRIGYTYAMTGYYSQALEYFQNGLEIAREVNAKRIEARLLTNIGLIQYYLGEYSESLRNHFGSIEIFEELEDRPGISMVYNNIAIVYERFGDPEKELDYYLKALEIDREVDNKQAIVLDLRNIGTYYARHGDTENGLKFYQEAIAAGEEINARYEIAHSLHGIGEIHEAQGQLDTALDHYQQALSIFRETGQMYGLSSVLTSISSVYLETGKEWLAIKTLGQALNILEEIQEKRYLLICYQKLSEAHKKVGNYRQALEYHIKYADLNNAIYNEENNRTITAMQARFDSESKEKEIEILTRYREIQTLKLKEAEVFSYGLITGIVLLISLVVLVYSQYRMKSNSNNVIKEKNEALTKAYKRLQELAKADPLTGLLNRRAFMDVLEYERIRSERSGKPFALVMGDIDYFKSINDSYGHDYGDSVLNALASNMISSLRKQDTVCRWGGEEFIILLPETNLSGAQVAAEKIRKLISSEPHFYDGNAHTITMTFGVAEGNAVSDLEMCIKSADEAMYRGKAGGRNCVVAA